MSENTRLQKGKLYRLETTPLSAHSTTRSWWAWKTFKDFDDQDLTVMHSRIPQGEIVMFLEQAREGVAAKVLYKEMIVWVGCALIEL